MLAQLVAHHPRGPGRPGLGTEGSDRQPVAQNTSTTLPILLLPWLTSAWDLRPAGRQSRAQLRTPDPQRRPATVSPSGCLRWLQATSAPTGGLGAPIQRRRRRRARAVEYLRACASAEVRIVGTGPQRIAQERQPFSGESAPAAQPRCGRGPGVAGGGRHVVAVVIADLSPSLPRTRTHAPARAHTHTHTRTHTHFQDVGGLDQRT